MTAVMLRTAPRARVPVERALSSDTRARILTHLFEVDGEHTVRDVAALFGLHPNVARTHLQTLADAGLVTVGTRKQPAGGRPARVYASAPEVDGVLDEAAATEVAASDPVLVVTLLAALVEAPGTDAAGRVVVGPQAGTTLTARALDTAADEGRRLVHAAGGASSRAQPLEVAADAVVGALRRYAPALSTRALESSEVLEVVGLHAAFEVLAHVKPELAGAFQRGLLVGAFGAAGVTAVVEPLSGEEPGWQVRRARWSPRAEAVPVATIDVRAAGREAGVVAAMRATTGLAPGEVLEVLTRGPGSPATFARWADRAGHALLAVERVDAPEPAVRLLIRKGP